MPVGGPPISTSMTLFFAHIGPLLILGFAEVCTVLYYFCAAIMDVEPGETLLVDHRVYGVCCLFQALESCQVAPRKLVPYIRIPIYIT